MASIAGQGGGGRRRGRGLISGINVTPLVDITLILLIIMMVSSTYIVSQTLKVDLPRSKTSDGAADAPSTLTIKKDGTLRWNNADIEEEPLAAELRAVVQKSPDVNLVITADKDVPHGTVVHFIDLARQSGIRKFAINVERRE